MQEQEGGASATMPNVNNCLTGINHRIIKPFKGLRACDIHVLMIANGLLRWERADTTGRGQSFQEPPLSCPPVHQIPRRAENPSDMRLLMPGNIPCGGESRFDLLPRRSTRYPAKRKEQQGRIRRRNRRYLANIRFPRPARYGVETAHVQNQGKITANPKQHGSSRLRRHFGTDAVPDMTAYLAYSHAMWGRPSARSRTRRVVSRHADA